MIRKDTNKKVIMKEVLKNQHEQIKKVIMKEVLKNQHESSV